MGKKIGWMQREMKWQKEKLRGDKIKEDEIRVMLSWMKKMRVFL